MRALKALYELDEHGEANGRVYFFCSETCRDEFRRFDLAQLPRVADGDDTDAIPGTVCDTCAVLLE